MHLILNDSLAKNPVFNGTERTVLLSWHFMVNKGTRLSFKGE